MTTPNTNITSSCGSSWPPTPFPPPRRRRPSSSHTKGRRLALTPPSTEILNRGADRGSEGGSSESAGGGRRRWAAKTGALADAPGRDQTTAGEKRPGKGGPGGEARSAPEARRDGAGGPVGPGARKSGAGFTSPRDRVGHV